MSHYEHGAVPESVKQQYLAQMLDFYKSTSMQHKLRPEEYTETFELPFLSGKPRKLSYDEVQEHGVWELPSVPETTISGTRYVTSRPEGMPENLSYGHVGPDYITMMNIMKAQADPNFNIGFMTDEYMKEKGDVGAYFSSGDQTIAFNPNNMLDWNDPRVQGAFGHRPTGMPEQLSYSGEGLRDLSMLEGTTLDFDPSWNRNVVAHELGHYGSHYRGNTPSVSSLLSEDGSGVGISNNKFEFPNWTQHMNMTKFDQEAATHGIAENNPQINYYGNIRDARITDAQGHNMAYWVGRAHDWDTAQGYNPSRDMYLNQQGAENYDAWRRNAQNYIRDANNPQPSPRTPERPNMRDVAGPATPTPRGNPHQGFNGGGIASLGGPWTPSIDESDEEIIDIQPFQLDPGIMSIDDLADLFEEAGLDKRIIYQLINTGGLSQLVA